jgi:hypothetical protein
LTELITERLRAMGGVHPETYVGKMRAEAADDLERLAAALRPFAKYVEGTSERVIPRTHVITMGSGFARRQLLMGDCYDAAALLKELGL